MPRTIRPTCDSCQILVINDVVCHEIGCPNSWKGTTDECKWCGRDFKLRRADQKFCSRSCERSYHR